jgi:hypothetical protein
MSGLFSFDTGASGLPYDNNFQGGGGLPYDNSQENRRAPPDRTSRQQTARSESSAKRTLTQQQIRSKGAILVEHATGSRDCNTGKCPSCLKSSFGPGDFWTAMAAAEGRQFPPVCPFVRRIEGTKKYTTCTHANEYQMSGQHKWKGCHVFLVHREMGTDKSKMFIAPGCGTCNNEWRMGGNNHYASTGRGHCMWIKAQHCIELPNCTCGLR